MRQVLKYRTDAGEWKVATPSSYMPSTFVVRGGGEVGILIRFAPEFEEGDRLYDSENCEELVVLSGPYAEYFPLTKLRKNVYLVRVENGEKYYHNLMDEEDLGKMRAL